MKLDKKAIKKLVLNNFNISRYKIARKKLK